MRPPKNQWSSTPQARMALFIAQSMQEMLSESSFESFRLPTLESLSRLREVGQIANSIENKHVPLAAIRSAIFELKCSIENDPILAQLDKPLVDEFLTKVDFSQTPSQKDIRNILTVCHVFFGRISIKYRERLELEFVDLIDRPDKKQFALKIIQSYLSLLINEGFDRSYILCEVLDRFFSEPVSKVGKRSFSRFVQIFKHNTRDYKTWLPVSQQVYNYVKIMSPVSIEVKKSSDVPENVKTALSSHVDTKANPAFILAKTEAADPYSAFGISQEILSAISSLTFLHKESADFRWASAAYTHTARAKIGKVVTSEGFAFQRSTVTASGARAKRLKRQAKSILTGFDPESTERILGATGAIALARTSKSPENQLISLWSAVETLLGSPYESSNRIDFYIDCLIPCICLTYPRRYLCAISDEILLHHGRAFKRATSDIETNAGDDQHTKFAALIFDETWSDQRKALFVSLEGNPLACHRIWKLHRNFSDPKSFHQSVVSHEDRVRWQISRIYRARNELVHAGRRAPWIKPLILNAFEYFKTAFVTLMQTRDRYDVRSSVEMLMMEIKLDYSMRKTYLSDLRLRQDNTSSDILSMLKRRS